MERTLAVYRAQYPTLEEWAMIQATAPAFHAARWYGVSNPEQAIAIMIKGKELGLGLAASFEFIKVIQGKPGLIPMGALALIQNSPLIEGIKITDKVDAQGNPESCAVWMRRTNGFEYTATFSMTDAQRAQLVKPDSGWDKYPANMLRWRAIGFCADVVCPDVLGGLKRTDELGADLTPDGRVVESSWRDVQQPAANTTPAPTATAPTIAAPAVTLDSLLERFTAEQILVANEGKLPGTDDELQQVAAKLEADNG